MAAPSCLAELILSEGQENRRKGLRETLSFANPAEGCGSCSQLLGSPRGRGGGQAGVGGLRGCSVVLCVGQEETWE